MMEEAQDREIRKLIELAQGDFKALAEKSEAYREGFRHGSLHAALTAPRASDNVRLKWWSEHFGGGE